MRPNALTRITSINTRLAGLRAVESSGNVVRCNLIAMVYTTGFARDVMIIQVANLIIGRDPSLTIYGTKQ